MDKSVLVERLRGDLRNVMVERQRSAADPALQEARHALKRFQVERMTRTHADLLASPATHDAARFFLDDLYGPVDMSQRDANLERIVPTMERLLPPAALETIAEAIALDALSERLDGDMAAALGANFSGEDYLRAYLNVTSHADRVQQIDYIEKLGTALCQLIRVPMIGTLLGMMRRPAKMANLAELHLFLERGWKAFKGMRDPAGFVDTIVQRERRLLEKICAGGASPADLGME
ncbi:FFLEELY motif protein [Noviherbaspirillum galbum]|uniref:DUF8198 domain-containing protein n=1 Tax=Noviherbaspirillum galbum TaxID=2709383 RepID=A0A6B3SM26_9BURK|nr:hypothetical protein [Noviherbaspirillum galbum]NEX61823.1 hypothetical protein [Noviherbaspirillum galbum]